MIRHWLLVISIGFFCQVSQVFGDITFGTGELGLITIVGAFNQMTPTTAIGVNLLDNSSIVLVTTDSPLEVNTQGAAKFEATGNLFKTIVFRAVGPEWLAVELNPQIVSGGQAGTFVLEALDQFGNSHSSGVFQLDAGNNRVWAATANGSLITQLTLSASDPLVKDVRQFRVSAIPEPTGAFLLLLCGTLLSRCRYGRNSRA